jgi:hypothetical protein
MRATTILLPEELQSRLRERAAREGISVAELLRRLASRAVEPVRGAGARRTGAKTRERLPRSVEEYLASPAGTFAAKGRRGRRDEPEDPYAGAD